MKLNGLNFSTSDAREHVHLCGLRGNSNDVSPHAKSDQVEWTQRGSVLDEEVDEGTGDFTDDGYTRTGHVSEISPCQHGPVDSNEVTILCLKVTVSNAPALSWRIAYPPMRVNLGRQVDIEVRFAQ